MAVLVGQNFYLASPPQEVKKTFSRMHDNSPLSGDIRSGDLQVTSSGVSSLVERNLRAQCDQRQLSHQLLRHVKSFTAGALPKCLSQNGQRNPQMRQSCRHCGSLAHRGARCPKRAQRVAALEQRIWRRLDRAIANNIPGLSSIKIAYILNQVVMSKRSKLVRLKRGCSNI